jgi:hypothetical protein
MFSIEYLYNGERKLSLQQIKKLVVEHGGTSLTHPMRRCSEYSFFLLPERESMMLKKLRADVTQSFGKGQLLHINEERVLYELYHERWTMNSPFTEKGPESSPVELAS